MSDPNWIRQKQGIRKFVSWIEDTQSKNSFDLSELLQLEQDFIKEQESESDD